MALSRIPVGKVDSENWQLIQENSKSQDLIVYTDRGDSETIHVIILTDSLSLLVLQKVKSVMGSPDWHVSMFDIHLQRILWVYGPGHAGVKGNGRAGKATTTGGLFLGRCEVLRSLRHYLRAQCQGHRTIDRLDKRGVERGSAQRSSLRG